MPCLVGGCAEAVSQVVGEGQEAVAGQGVWGYEVCLDGGCGGQLAMQLEGSLRCSKSEGLEVVNTCLVLLGIVGKQFALELEGAVTVSCLEFEYFLHLVKKLKWDFGGSASGSWGL